MTDTMKKFIVFSLSMAAMQLFCQAQSIQLANDSLKAIYNKATKGYHSAQNEVGSWYYYGQNVKTNYDQAVKWWSKSANQGNVYALGNLGMCYQLGRGVIQDSTKAIEYYTTSIGNGNAELLKQHIDLAEKGQVFSNTLLGMMYHDGKGVQKDLPKSVAYLERAGSLASMDAQRMLAVHYLNLRNASNAVKWIKLGASNGEPTCMYLLGKCMLEGNGVPMDKHKGVEWIERAAEKDHWNAIYLLGNCYMQGDGVHQDAPKAASYYRKAALKGHAPSMWSLALCYTNGEGADIDFDLATIWYAKALTKGYGGRFKKYCEKGSEDITNQTYRVYLSGLKRLMADSNYEAATKIFKQVEKAGITDGKVMQAIALIAEGNKESNLKKAVKILESCVEVSLRAEIELARLYLAGKGVKQDEAKGLTMLQHAADQGYVPAIAELGDHYYQKQDLKKALNMYRKLRELGSLSQSAAENLAHCYREGLGGLMPNAEQAEQVVKETDKSSVNSLLKLVVE